MASSLTPTKQENNFMSLINSSTVRNQVKSSLKENAGAFLSSMLDLYNSDSLLQKCDPNEVIRECLKAAALNLPIVKSLGFAYIVPFKNRPTLIIGYKGLIQLAQRTGQYKYINADVVYEGEFKGFNKLSGEIDLSGEKTSDKVIGYFAYIKLVSGFEKTLYMTKEQMEEWGKRYSPSFNSSVSPWKTEFDKMARKIVFRRLIGTYGAMTTELFSALKEDDKGVAPATCIEKNANKGEIIDMDSYDTDIPMTEDGEIIEPAPEEDF